MSARDPCNLAPAPLTDFALKILQAKFRFCRRWTILRIDQIVQCVLGRCRLHFVLKSIKFLCNSHLMIGFPGDMPILSH